MGPELLSDHCKGYPRAREDNGLTWLLPDAIWCLNDRVQLPQIKAVPWPQTAGGYTGTGRESKECVRLTPRLYSAEASVFSSRCAHLNATEVSTAQQYF